MKQTVSLGMFRDAFKAIRPDNFSYEGLEALFDYLEEIETGTDTEMELDVIALCCEFTEYESLKSLQDDYTDIETMEDLQDNTTVIFIDDESFIIQAY